MSVVGLINFLRLEGPHNQEHIPTASKEDAPPLGNKLTDKEGDSKEEGDASTEAGPVKEEDPKEDPTKEEPMEVEDPRRILT